MVDKAIVELRDLVAARRERLLRELYELEVFLRVCDSVQDDQSAASSEALWKALQAIHGPSAASPTPKAVVEAASAILREVGRPLARKDLLRRLIAAGVAIPGKAAEKNLGTILWRSGVIETVDRTYWFVGEEKPEPDSEA